jgi:hypothetical protein
MGGHHSRQSVSASENVVAKATMNVAQDCISYVAGSQTMDVEGSGNVFSGNVQRSSLVVDSKCMSNLSQSATFQDKLAAQVKQELRDQQVALTGWLNPGSDTQVSDIAQSVSTAVTYNDAQKCLNRLSGRQILTVKGDDNEVTNNLQSQTLSLVSDCMMAGSQAAAAVNSMTNSVNQHSTYVSKNPLAFIPDAIEATIKSVAAMAALVFIALIILVIVAKIAKGGRAQRRAEARAAAPTGA